MFVKQTTIKTNAELGIHAQRADNHYQTTNTVHRITKFLHLTVKIDSVEVAYYLKQVFHLQYDKSATPAEALRYFSLIS